MLIVSDYKEVTPEVRNIKIPQEQKNHEEPTITLLETSLKFAGFLSTSMFCFLFRYICPYDLSRKDRSWKVLNIGLLNAIYYIQTKYS